MARIIKLIANWLGYVALASWKYVHFDRQIQPDTNTLIDNTWHQEEKKKDKN